MAWWAGLVFLAVPAVAQAAPAGAAAVVEIRDDVFVPAVLRVRPGTAVTWRNAGRHAHTVTASDGSWDSGLLAPGQQFRRTFPRPGAYRYYCTPHGAPTGRGMAGLILVGEEAAVPPAPPPAGAAGRRVRRVPRDHPTIQSAVDAAAPGDLILLAPGVYREEVVVTTPGLTLRGLDRSRVILDGGFRLPTGIKVLGADGVAVENLTVRHYTATGVYFTGVRGYRASYVTAYNNGEYGLYAFDSQYGQFDRSHASGHPDSGFYIGQCKPCHALIVAVVAEGNALGYSGTNAGGDLTITGSIWRFNGAGVVPNTLGTEALAPQDGARIVANLVYSNHNRRAPALQLQAPAFGIGILLAGGINNVVEGNLVWDHPRFGILVAANLDRRLWVPSGHRIRANAVWASGLADLALAAPAGPDTCFADNRYARSLPPAIQRSYRCGSLLTRLGGGDPASLAVMAAGYLRAAAGGRPPGDWRAQPAPADQPGMPDPLAPARPAWPTPDWHAAPGSVVRAPAAPPAEAGRFAAAFPPSAPAESGRLAGYLGAWTAAAAGVAWAARAGWRAVRGRRRGGRRR